MAISREAIESLPRRKRRAQPSTTVDTYVEPQAPLDQPTRSSRIVSGLLSFTNEGTKAAVRSEKAKIDLDKVTQQQRALQGMDPTDDATKAGLRSYQIINMRDQVLETNAELAQRLRDNPDMSDEEYEVATREAYSGLLSQYQPDQQLSEALSNRLQESQTQLHQIRTAVRRDHQEFLKRDAVGSSIEEYREAAATPDELAQVIADGGSLFNEADALGVNGEEYRNVLINAAQRDANVGDGRLLTAIEQMEWASRDERVTQAREVYRRKEAQKNAVKIGSQWGDIQHSWKTRNSSWAQTEAAIQDLNERYPGAVTANQVASLKQQRDKIDADERRKTGLVMDGWMNLRDGDSMPIALRSDVTDSEAKEVVETMSLSIDEMVEQAVEAGDISPDEKHAYAMEKKLEVSRATGLEMPEFKRIFGALSTLDPADRKAEDGLPEWAGQALQTLPKLNEADIEQYGANTKVRAFINNYNAMRTTNDADPRAWRRAWSATYGETSLTPEQQSEVRDKAREVADESMDRSFIGWFTDDPVPDHIRSWVASEATREAHLLIGSGATDADEAGRAGAERAVNRFTKLRSGSAVNRNRKLLLAEAVDAQGNSLLRPEELDEAFEWLVGQNLETMDTNSAIDDVKMEDIRFHSRPGGLIMPTDKLGAPLLDSPITMQELGTQYREAVDSGRVEEALQNFRLRNEAAKARRNRELQKRGPGAGFAR